MKTCLPAFVAAIACFLLATPSLAQTAENNVQAHRAATDALRAIEQFVPNDAEVIIAFDPEKLGNNRIMNWLLSYEMLEPQLPQQLGKVELLVLAGTGEALAKVTSPNHSTFEDIAAELGGEPLPPASAATKLNERFAGMFRFEHPVLSAEIENWLSDADKDDLKYQSQRENGWEVFRCNNTESCVVVRVDDRTLIVGGQQSIHEGLVRLASVNDKPTSFALLIEPGMATREATVLLNVPALADEVLANPTNEFVALGQANWLRVELDESPLVRVRISFDDPKDATAAVAELVKPWQSYVGDMKTQLIPAAAADPDMKWLAEHAVKLFESLQVGIAGDDLIIEMPRPENWNEMMDRVAAWQDRARAEAEAAFEETARQLEAATEAAAEAGQSALEDVSDAPE